VHERVEFPGPVTLVGLRLQDELFDVRVTVPAKPLTAPMSIVDLPAVRMLTFMLAGLAVMVKSWTTSVTITDRTREPLVAVTRTCLIPVELNVQVRLEVPEPVTLLGERVQVLFVDRLTWPLNPFIAVIVIVDMPWALTLTLTVVGLAVIVKSCTVLVTVTEWDSRALVPVTPTWTTPPDAKVHESVEEPEPVTLVGDTLHEVLFVAKVTTPAKPFCPVMVIDDVPGDPAMTVTVVGLAAMLNS